MRSGDYRYGAFEGVRRIVLRMRPQQHGEISVRGDRIGHDTDAPLGIHSNGGKLRVKVRTGDLCRLTHYARSGIRTIQIDPERHIVGIGPLRSALACARARGKHSVKVWAVLNQVGQTMALGNPERVCAIAGLRKTTRRRAARLAVEPLVFSPGHAGFDLLLAIDVVSAGSSVPGKGIHIPMEGVV